jgi:hypothetical protein
MKMQPKLQQAQENMQPGVITSTGFLGNDTRQLIEIIQEDELAMRAENVDFEEAAERMRMLLEEGKRGLGEPTTVQETWLVRVDEARGFLACPFHDGIFRKRNALVENTTNQRKIYFSELSLHLFQEHHFLQGKGSHFRLEPRVLKAVLQL